MKYASILSALVLFACASSVPKETAFKSTSAAKIGASKTIVFVHGMFMTPACWEGWVKFFEAKGYRVSAPPWPLHERPVVEQASHPDPDLSSLTLDRVLEFYRAEIRRLPEKPIVIGHSMGGLVAQILVSEGLAVGAVAIDSAPPKGLISLKWSFLKSNWGAISPFASLDEPIQLSLEDFSYAFVNGLPENLQKKYFDTFAVPESRRVGKGPTTETAVIDYSRARGPLLLVAGEMDHIIPSSLNWENYQEYESTPGITSFREFPGRNHFLIGDDRWNEIAQYAARWIDENR